MKKIKILSLICAGLISSSVLFATDNQPEGVSTSISKADIEDVLAWANNSKTSVEKVQQNYVFVEFQKRLSYLKYKVGEILKNSGKAENELLMRITLNRALELNKLLDSTPKSLNSEYIIGVHMLENGMELAKSFYEHDLDYLSKIKNGEKIEINFSSVSKKMLQIFTSYAKEISDSKKIEFKKMLLSWYLVDLNKTASLRREKAQEIKEIYEILNDNSNFYTSESLDQILNKKIESVTGGYISTPSIYLRFTDLKPGLFYAKDDSGLCVLALRENYVTKLMDVYVVPNPHPKASGSWQGCSERKSFSIETTKQFYKIVHMVNQQKWWDNYFVRKLDSNPISYIFGEFKGVYVYWKSE